MTDGMDELVVVETAQNEAEAVTLCALLESAGIETERRITNLGAGFTDGWSPASPQEILVRAEDAELAREVLKPTE
jgi:hypothetical protein